MLGCILCGGDAANPSTDSGVRIGKFLAGRGTKEVFRYGDRKAIAFIMKGDPAASIRNELNTIKVLRELGFETQNSEQTCYTYSNGEKRDALVMDSWEYLTSVGMQVRDSKNGESRYGHSMIIGTMENINRDRAACIMGELSDEAVRLMANGIAFGADGYNIVIKDTDETAEHDRSVPGLYDARRQEIRLFLSDFTTMHGWDDWVKRNYRRMFDRDTKKPSRKKIREEAYYVYGSCECALIAAVTNEEKDIISRGANCSRGELIIKLLEVLKEIKEDMLRDVVDRVSAALEGKYEEKCE